MKFSSKFNKHNRAEPLYSDRSRDGGVLTTSKQLLTVRSALTHLGYLYISVNSTLMNK